MFETQDEEFVKIDIDEWLEDEDTEAAHAVIIDGKKNMVS